ncbi:MAG: SDR family oxidoreductase [Candidatus Binatia bacterium]
MDLGLDGKVVLVTAASRGIGLACARAFLDEGAAVAINARDEAGLAAAAKQLGERGRVTYHPADLSSEADTARLLAAVEHAHDRLDVLVSNTGGPTLAPVLDTTLDDWATAYQLLLRPAVQLAQGAAQRMTAHGSGSIVFLTSTWVKQPKAGGVLSAAMRSGVAALSKQLALELAPQGVRVNQVLPGAVATDRMRAVAMAAARRNGTSEETELQKMVADIPLARWGTPEEIAAAAVFLASPRSGFTTGASLQVDGGLVRFTL